MIRKLLFSILITLSSLSAIAQEKIEINESDYTNNEVEMADAFRADGKIFVVVAVILVMLIGLFIYLILIDRKVKRLENQLNKS